MGRRERGKQCCLSRDLKVLNLQENSPRQWRHFKKKMFAWPLAYLCRWSSIKPGIWKLPVSLTKRDLNKVVVRQHIGRGLKLAIRKIVTSNFRAKKKKSETNIPLGGGATIHIIEGMLMLKTPEHWVGATYNTNDENLEYPSFS